VQSLIYFLRIVSRLAAVLYTDEAVSRLCFQQSSLAKSEIAASAAVVLRLWISAFKAGEPDPKSLSRQSAAQGPP